MINGFRLFLLTIKQTFKRPVIIIFMLAIPICVYLLNRVSYEEESVITAMYYIKGNDSADKELADALKKYDGLFKFVSADSEKELTDCVKRNEYECGYIFEGNIFDEMMSGNTSDLIRVVYSDKSTMTPIINETVFSVVFPIISEMKLEKYLTEKGATSEAYDEGLFDEELIKTFYNINYTNGSTFSFRYSGEPEGYTFTKQTILLAPVRGVLSLIILISAFAGAFAFYKEGDNPVFAIAKVRLSFVAVPALISMLVAYISILVSGLSENALYEALYLIIYTSVVILYTFILCLIIKKGASFAGLLPIIVIGCIAFTPVFIDISTFIPSLNILKYLWPTHYYLMFF